ncbi:GAF domain-containing protein [Bosea sp. 2YAB26]|uniref:GAF domain-containing protein n=1 Tax=Bosea sp. 2YAB26 TaxID=3237478 RepID=UPI003F91A41A
MVETARGLHADRIYSTLNNAAAVAQSAVAASWSRSAVRYGLDPNHARPPWRLSQHEFDAAFERLDPLIRVAQSTLDRLFQSVGDAGCCVLFTDREGVPLDRRGVVGDDVDFRNIGLWTGMVWSEASEGTNGVGTCLAEGRPLTIHRDQHFLTRNIGLSCSVAPIWDAQGRLIATLDVSTCRADLTPAMLKLVASATLEAAHRIEAHHFRMVFPKARIVVAQDRFGGGGGLLAVDKEDLVIGASRAARLAYGLTDERLAHPFPADDLLAGDEARPAEALSAAERGVVQRALARANGNVSAAARMLGVSRATMHRKLTRLGLQRGR